MLAEHQVAAVERALAVLCAHRGVILADGVGLGKSFVAAEVARRLGGEVEVIVPAALVPQWRELGVGTVLTHDRIANLPFVADPSRERLVIVDEAHAFRNPKTQRYDALARRTLAARVLLVTATPVCNSARDLHALLSLIVADDALASCGIPSIDLAFERSDFAQIETIVGELLIRRDRSVLPPALQFGDLQRNVIRHSVPDLPIDALQLPEILKRFLWRRLESSQAALFESLRRQRRYLERVLESGRPLSKADYRRAFGSEDDLQQILFWDLWAPPAAIDVGAIREELKRIDAIRPMPDRKRELLPVTSEPTLIFTTFAATARELARHLRCGVATARDGTGAIEAFRRGAIDTLVCTDLAAEGLNLQRAGVVVHYDLPWNPVKLDQRNGRAHRIGQRRDSVRAVYFIPERDVTRVAHIVAAKNRVRRKVLKAGNGGGPTTLRPRVVASSGAARLAARLEIPEHLEKRHKAGLERLLAAMSTEILDPSRVADLLALAGCER